MLLKKNSFLILITILLFAFVFSLVFLLTKKGKSLTTNLDKELVPTFFLEPNQGRFKSQEVFPVEVFFDTAGKKISAVGAILSFDPSVLKVLEIKETNIFGLYPSKKFDNQKGEIKISGLCWDKSLGKPQAAVFGKNKLATVKFLVKPISQETETKISFYFLNMGNTTDSNIMEADTAKDVLGEIKNGKYSLVP